MYTTKASIAIVENKFQTKLTFQNIDEFDVLIKHYMFNQEARLNYSKNAIKYINTELPEKKLSTLWSDIFKWFNIFF